MRSKLLSHLFDAFERSPNASPALVISHADGLAWSIADGTLAIESGLGSPLVRTGIADLTVVALASVLTTAGLTVRYQNPEFAGLSALVLLDDSGSAGPNTDASLLGHRSVLWALMSAYAVEVKDAASRVPLALEQARLHSADGDWLDFWGGFFGIVRPVGLPDANYLQLIIVETLRHRANRYALENAIKDATGHLVTIDEPWTRIFTLDVSTLSGGDKFKDGVNIGRNLIRPVSATSIDWTGVLPVIHRNRAAGVIVLTPQVNNVAVLIANDQSITASATRLFVADTKNLHPMRLDIDALDDRPTLNIPVVHRLERRVQSYSKYPSSAWASVTWSQHTGSWGDDTTVIVSTHKTRP